MRVFTNPQLPTKKSFVLFLLHKQPESSINVQGTPFCNQVEIIRALARTLPLDHDLYVKEHIVALPHRPFGFYAELKRIPGVCLITPFADTFDLMKHSTLVVTITGTAAFEATLLGRPAATIAPVYFENFIKFPRFNPFKTPLGQLIKETYGHNGELTDEQVNFFASFLAQSYSGEVGDAFWFPWSMDHNNISQVANGFLDIINIYSKRNKWATI